MNLDACMYEGEKIVQYGTKIEFAPEIFLGDEVTYQHNLELEIVRVKRDFARERVFALLKAGKASTVKHECKPGCRTLYIHNEEGDLITLPRNIANTPIKATGITFDPIENKHGGGAI